MNPPVTRHAPSTCRAAALKARVLHVINGEDYSGAERVQDLLAMQLPQYGYEAAFSCVRPGRFDMARCARSVPLYTVPMRSRFDLRPVPVLARLIRAEGFDLVHTHSPRTVLVGRPAAALAGVPLVHHMHGQTSVEVVGGWRGRFNAAVERICLLRAAAVIVVRASLRPYLRRQLVPERRIWLVPNGVPTLGLLPHREVPHGQWTLGTVAMFRPHKGLDVLLHALALLRAQNPSVHLRAVGCFQTPAYEAHIKGLVARLGLAEAVAWSGFSGDVGAELARMDLFVQPSLAAEGIPMAMLEAMAAGVPVVGSRVPGISDAIRDRVDGLLVEPGDAVGLAEVLANVIGGRCDWQALRQRGHARQAEAFSDRSMVAGVANVYDHMLSRAGAASGSVERSA